LSTIIEGQQEKKRLKKAMKGTRLASSKGKAPGKKKNDEEDVFSDQPKKLNTKKPMTTKPASSFSLPSLGDETSTESEGPPDSIIPRATGNIWSETDNNHHQKESRTNVTLFYEADKAALVPTVRLSGRIQQTSC
jgi:hypothetical protein